MLERRTAILASILVGVSLYISVWQVSGASDPWSDPAYWQIAIPLAVLAAACIGYLAKGTSWLAVLLIVPAQMATIVVKGGEPGSLGPRSLGRGLALALLFLVVAWITARVRPSHRR